MPIRPEAIPDLGAAQSASDFILKIIRDAIIAGEFDEGEPIRQDDVARSFNVSKIPVREALKRLEAEGLVKFQRNKGAVVASVSEPEIVQMFEVRAILESNAIRLSVPYMTEASLARSACYCEAFAGDADVARWADLNWRFHSSLYEAAERPFLLNMIRSVHDRIERYVRVQLTLSGGRQIADREHRGILEACRDGDASRAGDLTYAHIMRACASLLEFHPKIVSANARRTAARDRDPA